MVHEFDQGLCGRDGWCTLAVVLDCATREVLGWRLASQGNAATAEAAKYYNLKRPHQALKYQAPSEAMAIVA